MVGAVAGLMMVLAELERGRMQSKGRSGGRKAMNRVRAQVENFVVMRGASVITRCDRISYLVSLIYHTTSCFDSRIFLRGFLSYCALESVGCC